MTDAAATPRSAELPSTADVLSLVFASESDGSVPEVVFVLGASGSGRSRATARLLVESPGLAVVRSEDLAALHPLAGDARARDVAGEVDRATVGWLQACLRHAREAKQSLMLDAAFTDPAVVFQTAARFRADGFRSRVVVTATRRAESLLATVSGHLRASRTPQAVPPLDVTTHDKALAATRVVIEECLTSGIDRVRILDRSGATAYDTDRDTAGGVTDGSLAAYDQAQRVPLGTVRSALWLSELHRCTEFVQSQDRPARPVVSALIELHDLAATQIVPELNVRKDADLVTRQLRSHAADAADLRRRLTSTGPAGDATRPTIPPPTVGQPGAGLSR